MWHSFVSRRLHIAISLRFQTTWHRHKQVGRGKLDSNA